MLKTKKDFATQQKRVIRGANVLVTGAARGMGELYVRSAIKAGAASVALWDIDAEKTAELVKKVARPGVKLYVYEVDAGNLKAIKKAFKDVQNDLGNIDVLINNAGIVRGKPFWEHDHETDIEQTMRVNTLGPMWLTREVLPTMMIDRTRPKRILNIASAAGNIGNPNMSVYASSKWALIGWAESVRLELKKRRYSHIRVTTFNPSYISTGMFEGARGPLLTPIMDPRAATNEAWRGMILGKPIVNKPWTVKLAMAVRGVLPTGAWDFIAKHIFKVYSSMDNFTGRKQASQ